MLRYSVSYYKYNKGRKLKSKRLSCETLEQAHEQIKKLKTDYNFIYIWDEEIQDTIFQIDETK